MTPLWSEISGLSIPQRFRASCKSRVSSFNSFLLASKNAIIFTIKLDILSRDAVTLGWNIKSDDLKFKKDPFFFTVQLWASIFKWNELIFPSILIV